MAAVLSPDLRRQLDLIEPSVCLPGVSLYPCSAGLRDGTVIQCVYFVTAAAFKRLWGREMPEEVPGKRGISPDQVASVGESPYRLPAGFANEIYRAGESGNGYHDFTLVFSFWCRRDYVVGSLVDFLYYPRWHGPADVKRVVLYLNRRRPRPQPETFWCVYATAEG